MFKKNGLIRTCQYIFCVSMFLLTSCTTNEDNNKSTISPGKIDVTPTLSLVPTQNLPDFVAVSASNNSVAVRVILFDQSGRLWTGGPDGLTYWDLANGKTKTYSFTSDPGQSRVVALTETPDQSLWVGSFGKGIFRVDLQGEWQQVTKLDGLPSDYISHLIANEDGSLTVNTSPLARDNPVPPGGYLGILKSGQWIEGVGGGFYKLLYDPDGNLWAVDWPPNHEEWKPISRFIQGKWETFSMPDEPQVVYAINFDPDGTLWVATKNMVYFFDKNGWNSISPPWQGKTYAGITDIQVAPDRSVWFSFAYQAGVEGVLCGYSVSESDELGVYRFDGETWTHFTTDDGLIANKICDIAVSPDGSIWFGSYENGLSKYDGTYWTSFSGRN